MTADGDGPDALAANVAKAERYLQRFRENGVRNWIGGEDEPADAAFETLCPATGAPICEAAESDAEDVAAACEIAREAFPAWRDYGGKARRALLHRIADGIEARAEEIAFLECMDTGQALRFMSKAA
ncbi:MAG: aldehyde dehydrogenase family protein, partial [Pseudomonadota bacterium]